MRAAVDPTILLGNLVKAGGKLDSDDFAKGIIGGHKHGFALAAAVVDESVGREIEVEAIYRPIEQSWPNRPVDSVRLRGQLAWKASFYELHFFRGVGPESGVEREVPRHRSALSAMKQVPFHTLADVCERPLQWLHHELMRGGVQPRDTEQLATPYVRKC